MADRGKEEVAASAASLNVPVVRAEVNVFTESLKTVGDENVEVDRALVPDDSEDEDGDVDVEEEDDANVKS